MSNSSPSQVDNEVNGAAARYREIPLPFQRPHHHEKWKIQVLKLTIQRWGPHVQSNTFSWKWTSWARSWCSGEYRALLGTRPGAHCLISCWWQPCKLDSLVFTEHMWNWGLEKLNVMCAATHRIIRGPYNFTTQTWTLLRVKGNVSNDYAGRRGSDGT